MKPSERVGILGLGRMGRAMAARLSGHGVDVSGWTRSGLAPEDARALQINARPSIRSVADAADIIVLSLSDDAAVTAVVENLCQGDLAGKLVVDTSTVSPDTLRRLNAALKERGAAALDAPISGGPDLILSGKAGFFIGGDRADFQRFKPVAEVLSDRIHHVGALGEGAAAKIVNNMLLLGYWGCLKEAVQVGKRAGLSLEKMMTILSGSPAATGLLVQRMPAILGQSEQIGFTISGVVKDGHLFTRTAQQLAVPVPAIESALASYRACEDAGYGDSDFSALIRTAYLMA